MFFWHGLNTKYDSSRLGSFGWTSSAGIKQCWNKYLSTLRLRPRRLCPILKQMNLKNMLFNWLQNVLSTFYSLQIAVLYSFISCCKLVNVRVCVFVVLFVFQSSVRHPTMVSLLIVLFFLFVYFILVCLFVCMYVSVDI